MTVKVYTACGAGGFLLREVTSTVECPQVSIWTGIRVSQVPLSPLGSR